MALNLITRQEYKAYVGIKSTNEDAAIDALIPRASQFVKAYCKRTFVDYMDAPRVDVYKGGSSIILTETPVVSIVSVERSTDYGRTYAPLSEYDSWVLDGYQLLPTSDKVFPSLVRGYRVTYFAGYDDVPPDLALAVMDLVTYYRKNDSVSHAQKASGSGSLQIEYLTSTTLPAHIRRVLDLYVEDYT